MTLHKSLSRLVAAAAFATVFAGVAHAQQQVTFATLSSFGGNNVFTYTGGPTGGFGITPGNGNSFFSLLTYGQGAVSMNIPVEFAFSTGALTNVGVVTTSGGPTPTSSQDLSGGRFTITDRNSASATFNQVLLSGTFQAATLSGNIGANQGGVATTLNSLIYDNTSYFVRSGLSNPGGLSINLTSITNSDGTSGLRMNGAYFNNFTAAGSATFSATATAVPEPSEYALMGMAAVSLGGLMFRARRRSTARPTA